MILLFHCAIPPSNLSEKELSKWITKFNSGLSYGHKKHEEMMQNMQKKAILTKIATKQWVAI
jgi:hypothetical protein